MDFSPTALYDRLYDDLADTAELPAELAAHRAILCAMGERSLGNGIVATWLRRPEAPAKDFARAHLLDAILKKYIGEATTPAGVRAKLAIDKFLEINESCRMFAFDPSQLSIAGEQCDGDVMDVLYHACMRWDGPVFTWRDVLRHAEFGPGSSRGAKGDSEYEKRSMTLGATTVGVYQQWKLDHSSFELAGKVELTRTLAGWGGIIDDASKLSCVDKTSEIDRTICSEPSANIYYQLGLGGCLEWILRKSFQIDLETQQELNRELARVGSATGRYATIDLSSASDSISVTIVKRLFPREIWEKLMRFRCSSVILPDGERVELHMISSMGNGFTFPLQTMIFAAIVRAAYRICGIPYRGSLSRSPTFGVNGDDIIVDTRAYGLVIEMLTAYGFTVNRTKTFCEGPFRESCGGDYFKGHFVRGVYAKSLESKQDYASLINRLIVWAARWDTPLKKTVGFLLSCIRGRVLRVPRWDTETAGIHVPESLCNIDRRCESTGSIMYERWAARPVVYSLESSVLERTRREAKAHKRMKHQLQFNEAALLLCSVRGSIRNCTYGVRSLRVVRYESRVSIAPCWEMWGDTQWRDLSIPAVSRQRWTRAAVEHLKGVL